MKNLYEKWFGPILPKPSIPMAEIVKYVFLTLVPIVFLLSLVGLWYLNRQVKTRTRNLNEEKNKAQKSEKEFQKSEKMFATLFQQAGGYSMVLEPSPSGIPTILDANKAACEAHGFTPDEMIGKPVADLDDEEGRKIMY